MGANQKKGKTELPFNSRDTEEKWKELNKFY